MIFCRRVGQEACPEELFSTGYTATKTWVDYYPQKHFGLNKTGSTARLCGDMGILKGVRYPYVMVGIIERKSKASNYGEWMHSRGRVFREI